MAQIIYTHQALADFDRLTDFLIETFPVAALDTVELIIEAIMILANHPLVGRNVEPDLKELTISRGQSGYVALYSYEAEHDTVLILALRHQREIGYDMN